MRLSPTDKKIKDTKPSTIWRRNWISLFFCLPLTFTHLLLPYGVYATPPDAFHSPLAVPGRRYSVIPIYVWKWLAFPPYSSLPATPPLFPPLATIHLSNGMHLGMEEGLHLSARTFQYICQGKDEIYYISFRTAWRAISSFQLQSMWGNVFPLWHLQLKSESWRTWWTITQISRWKKPLKDDRPHLKQILIIMGGIHWPKQWHFCHCSNTKCGPDCTSDYLNTIKTIKYEREVSVWFYLQCMCFH